MITSTYSRWDRFYDVAAVKSVPFVTNGQCVQLAYENGQKRARPSTGVTDTFFLGISLGVYRGIGATMTKIEAVKTGAASGATATAILSKTSVGNIYIYKGVDYSGTLMTATTSHAVPTGASDFDLSAADNRTIIVDDANANTDLFVVYEYTPNANDIRFAYEGGGDIFPGNDAQAKFGRITVITEGIVYTDQFDTSINWANVVPSTPIRGGANGKFKVGGSGCDCSSGPSAVRVHAIPTADVPYLGLTLGPSI